MDITKIKQQLAQAGLQERPAQLAMIEAVRDAVQKKSILCVEAPTGTGKTLSYVIGGLLSKTAKQTLLISTATITLQEQLVEKDLPLIKKILGVEAKVALAKGRRRYVCNARLYEGAQEGDLFSTSSDSEKLQGLLDSKSWNGDRDQLGFTILDSEWQKLSTDSSGCSGRSCAFFDDCVFFKARKKIHTADIIVTNHSLLLSDLELGSGAILPEPEKLIYIIDECHHLPHKALDHFAKSASVMGSVEWINQMTRALTKAVQANQIDTSVQKRMNVKTHELIEALQQLREFLESNDKQFDDDGWRIKTGIEGLDTISTNILGLAREVQSVAEIVHGTLDEKLQRLGNTESEERENLTRLINAFGFAFNRSKNLLETWELFCHQRKEGEAPIAKWFTMRDNLKTDNDALSTHYYCHTSPINISQKLEKLFWDKIENGVVLCSATVQSLGNFDDYLRKTGLKNNKKLITHTSSNLFDYTRSLLYIPKMKVEPVGANQSAHQQEVIEILPKLIFDKNGTLVLFTSKFAMEKTYAEMPDDIYKDILMQGKKTKSKLIELHKKRIRSGKRSILFGLTSFGEGLDLPADFCQHVIINKLPFAVPSTPIEQTRNEWLTANNKNAFMLSALPAASLRLTQYVGRLVRQETDQGIVTILDKRLYSKNYGAKLLANLPNFQRLTNEDINALKATDVGKVFYGK